MPNQNIADWLDDIPADADLVARAADLCQRIDKVASALAILQREYTPLQIEILTRGLGDELLTAVRSNA